MTRVVNVDGKNYTIEECMDCIFYHDGGPERAYCNYPARRPRRFEGGPGPFIDGIVDTCPLKEIGEWIIDGHTL
jgi:hypothetical protein